MKTFKRISKMIFTLLGSFFISSAASAAMKCYDFGVSRYSNGLQTLSVSVSSPMMTNEKATVRLTARRSPTLSAEVTYECLRRKRDLQKIDCIGDHGDFSLNTRGSLATLTLTYLNLGVQKPDVELTEDFAIFDAANDIDSGESTDHAEQFVIQGKRVLCEI